MTMNEREFLKSAGLQIQVLEFWITREWLVPQPEPDGRRFTDMDLARVRLIRELQSELGANDAGVDVILHLMDQLHGMRQVLAQLRQELQKPSP